MGNSNLAVLTNGVPYIETCRFSRVFKLVNYTDEITSILNDSSKRYVTLLRSS